MPYTSYEEYSDLLDKTLNKVLTSCNNDAASLGSSYIQNWNTKVKNVTVLLSASRGGSSLLKEVLSQSPDVVSLPGEEEPYYILTKNVYPFGSESDRIVELKDMDKILKMMWYDLGINDTSSYYCISSIAEHWHRRLAFQFPQRDFSYNDIVSKVEAHYHSDKTKQDYNLDTNNFLIDILGPDAGLYDVTTFNSVFNKKFKIEEPPFVVPGNRKPFTPNDLETKTFLFKTPQDYCRPGIFEQLFPNADITYIHLTRGYAQSVNGLMDGWLSDTGFFSYNVGSAGTKLNIKGYSDVHPMGRDWWNFDLFPGWKDYIDKPLAEVCAAQWKAAHHWITNEFNVKRRFKFEDFLENKQAVLNDICDTIGINSWQLNDLPNVMSTDKPKAKRWHKRKDLMMSIQHDTSSVMNMLDYSTDTETWI